MLASLLPLHGQVRFRIADGISDGRLKHSIETSLSDLLSEVNQACSEQRLLSLNRLNMTKEAQSSLYMLWENVRFECPDPVVVERILGLDPPGSGYQVRSIPIEMHPIDTLVSPDELYKEAVVEFNAGGKIVSFYFGLDVTNSRKVMRSGQEVTDRRQRMMILDYVEHLRTAYNQHDSLFIEQVFSEDAIIITGKVTEIKKSDVKNPYGKLEVSYEVKNKKQYMASLKKVFRKNKYINVVFEDIRLASHPTKKDFYGVTLKQDYTSSTYSDVGYLFLLWDFRKKKPQIHVRTWQPYWLDEKEKQALPEDEIYDLSSFDLSQFDY